MKNIKNFNDFLNESSKDLSKNVMVIWSDKEDHSLKSAVILDRDSNVLTRIDNVFNERTGEYSEDCIKKMKEYGVKGSMMGDNVDLYTTGENTFSEEDAIERYKQDKERTKRIADFLTPDKTKELLNILKKKK